MGKQTSTKWFFQRRLQQESPFERMLIHAVLILACLITIYPALRVLTISLRPGNRVLSTSLEIIPPDASFENYKAVIVNKDFLRWIWNSAVITISTSIIGVILASTGRVAIDTEAVKVLQQYNAAGLDMAAEDVPMIRVARDLGIE